MTPDPQPEHPWQMFAQMMNGIYRDFYAGGDEMKSGADVIPEKNLNERLNELEDDLNEAALVARDAYLLAGNVYLIAQDRHTAFLLMRNKVKGA